MIEEAAGITKFKTRKRLAEAKLESAKQNLARVYDILEEVTRQVNSLKRQASKAKRYSELKNELEARLQMVLAGKFRLLERDAAKTAIDLEPAAGELKTFPSRWPSTSRRTNARRRSCYEFERSLPKPGAAHGDEPRSGAHARAAGSAGTRSGAIEQRIAQAEKESQDLGVCARISWTHEIAGHKQNRGDARGADRPGPRPHDRD